MRDIVTVSQTAPERRVAALSILFSHLVGEGVAEQVDELLAAEARRELSLEGLLSAEIDDGTVGAVLYLMQADQCAYVWSPVVISSGCDPERTADALLQELKRRVTAEGAWIAQCLIEPDANVERETLMRNGFLHLTDLDYLTRRLADPLPAGSERPFETVSFRPEENFERFAEVIEKTYVGSLDCPELEGIRSGAEAISSHSATGIFMPERWTIFRDEGRDVGVLIFADHPDQDAWEVVYMGILPEARGRGYGKAMLHSGLRDARAGSRSSVLLAVDSRNRFARRVYDDLGFELFDVRSVHAMFPTSAGKNPQIVHSQKSGC